MAGKAGSCEMKIQKNTPKISVLMCVHNGEKFLPNAISSILSQTYEDFEFVIVDDGSNGTTKSLLASYKDPRIVLITNLNNVGLTKSLNIGLGYCRGEFIARMDGDDISHAKRLEKQAIFLESRPDIAVVGTQIRHIDDAGKKPQLSHFKKGTTSISCRWQSIFDSPITHSSAMCRKAIIVNKLGGYNESFRTSQDYELWVRVLSSHEIENLNEALLDFRSHNNSVSKSYTVENIIKVADLFTKNLNSHIGVTGELSDFGLNWVTVTNPSVLPNLVDYRIILNQFNLIYKLFSDKYFSICSQNEKNEIKNHAVQKLYLICYAASDHDKGATLMALMQCLKLKLTLSVLSKGLLLFLFGHARLKKINEVLNK